MWLLTISKYGILYKTVYANLSCDWQHSMSVYVSHNHVNNARYYDITMAQLSLSCVITLRGLWSHLLMVADQHVVAQCTDALASAEMGTLHDEHVWAPQVELSLLQCKQPSYARNFFVGKRLNIYSAGFYVAFETRSFPKTSGNENNIMFSNPAVACIFLSEVPDFAQFA